MLIDGVVRSPINVGSGSVPEIQSKFIFLFKRVHYFAKSLSRDVFGGLFHGVSSSIWVYFSFGYLIGIKKLFFLLLLIAIILSSGKSPYLLEQKHRCRSQPQYSRADRWELVAAFL